MKNEYKIYKKFTKKIVCIVVVIVVIIGVLNYVINPFNIFNNNLIGSKMLKPKAKMQERYTKFIAFKLDKREIDAVFTGTSRVDLALSKDYYKQLTTKNAENLAMGGFLLYEYLDIFKKMIIIHPEVKNFYVGVDFATFSKNKTDKNEYTRFSINPVKKLLPEEIGFALFSGKGAYCSIWTAIKNMMGIEKRMFNPDGTRHMFLEPRTSDYFIDAYREYVVSYEKYVPDERGMDILKELKKLCDEHGINLYIFIMPTHITDEYLINKMRPNEYAQWKKNLTKISKVYDFQYPSEYTTEDISPEMKYFFEASHSTYLLGNKILERLTGKNSDFGRILDENNVSKYVMEDKKSIDNYVKSHPQVINWVEKSI